MVIILPKEIEEKKDTEAKKEPEKENKDEKKDISAEDNIITADEMQALESKETKIKDGLMGKIFKKKKEDNKEQKQDNSDEEDDQFPAKTEIKLIKKDLKDITSKVNTISIDTEKLDGKLESDRAQEAGLQERISHLTEEIGEIRSMVLDRERSFNEIESGYKKIQVLADDIQPALIKKEFEKKEREVVELTVKVEQIEAISQETNKQIKLFREQMDKIRSLDNLLRVSKEIEGDIEKIKDTERYTGRMAAKTEEMFSELDKRITQFAAQSEKVNSLDEISKDLMQSVDKNEVKLKEAVFKEDLEKLKSTVNQTISENVKKELEPIIKETNHMKENISKLKDKDELIALGKMLRHPKGEDGNGGTDNRSDLPALEDIIFRKNQELMKTIAEQDMKIQELSAYVIKIGQALNSTPNQQGISAHPTESIDFITDELSQLKNRLKCLESRPGPDTGAYDTYIKELYSITKSLESRISSIAGNIQTSPKIDDNMQSLVEENSALRNELDTMKQTIESMKNEETKTESGMISLKEKLSSEEHIIRNIMDKMEKNNNNMNAIPLRTTRVPIAMPHTNEDYASENLIEKSRDIEILEKDMDELEKTRATTNSQYNSHNNIINPETIIYDHDLRLNKLIRLIEKTEWLIDNGKPEDAKSAYDELKSTYDRLNSKVPENQMTEIEPRIEKLEDKLLH